MWTCSVCETKNNDDDRFCACCGNARPASAAPKASRPVGNNQSGSASRPAASQNTPRTQGARKTRPAPAQEKKSLSYEEKRLMELRSSVKIPENPATRLDNHLGYWLRHLIGCFLLGTVAGAVLSYLPSWLLGDLVEKLGGTALVTSEMMEPLMTPAVILCYVLYWVMIIFRRKHASEFQAMWKDGEIICRWHPVKDTHDFGVGVGGEWIAYDSFVLNGTWIKQDGMVVGLRCAYDHRPGKAVIAQISVEGGTMKFTGAAYISVANVQ